MPYNKIYRGVGPVQFLASTASTSSFGSDNSLSKQGECGDFPNFLRYITNAQTVYIPLNFCPKRNYVLWYNI